MRRVAIHQPNYLPWIGFFHKVARVDEFVFFDDVQLPQGKSFCSRVKIMGSNGSQWLTVPTAKGSDVLIKDARVVEDGWRRKHLKTLEVSYRKTPHFQSWWPVVSARIEQSGDSLADLNISLITALSEVIGLKTRFRRASELRLGPVSAEDHIYRILQAVEADVYVSGEGAGSRRYIDEAQIRGMGMQLEWQNFSHPVYPQGNRPFEDFMSVVDMLSFAGPDYLRRCEQR